MLVSEQTPISSSSSSIYSLSIHPTDIELVISIECEIHSSKLNKLNNFNVHKVYSNKYNINGNCKDKMVIIKTIKSYSIN